MAPLLPISYKLAHENDETQLANNNICVTVLAISYSFFLDPKRFYFILLLFFLMSVKIDYLNFREIDMTIFAEKKKKNAQRKEEER